MGAGQAGSVWGLNGVNYWETINDNMLVIVQMETPVGRRQGVNSLCWADISGI